MNNLIIGLLALAFSLFICFLSPKEGKNVLGYKSPQQGTHKNIWKWSNRFFGVLAIIGSVIYIIITIVFKILSIKEYNNKLNLYGMVYIFLCIIATEIYTFVKASKNR
mgnify:CR=1 FL=1